MAVNLKFLVAILLLTASVVLAVIIPPFQSPDENDHIKRAFLLSRGVLIVETPHGMSSGGLIDSGLLTFMDAYPPRMTAQSVSPEVNKLTWTGNRIFSAAPGTGYYLPLVYAPQAVALAIGQALDLTIDLSYRLARGAALAASLLLIVAALSLYPASPLVLALLALPMTLFQLSSASLDGITTGLALFAVAAFMRIAQDREDASRWLTLGLALAVVLLATSRIHAAPLLLLLLAACYIQRDWRAAVLFVVSVCIFLAWTYFAMNSVADLRVAGNQPPGMIVSYYLTHPFAFVSLVAATLSAPNYLNGYLVSFLGVLGWLDASFSAEFYQTVLRLVAVIGGLSLSLSDLKSDWPERLVLLLLSAASAALVFLALLVTWNPHPAHLIDGVQGRYFLIPAIMLSYAVAGGRPTSIIWGRGIALFLCLCLFLVSLRGTAELLLERYHLPSAPSQTGAAGMIPLDILREVPDLASAMSSHSPETRKRFALNLTNSWHGSVAVEVAWPVWQGGRTSPLVALAANRSLKFL